MKSMILYIFALLLFLSGCAQTGYQPYYIISKDEPDLVKVEPEEVR